MYVKIIAIIIHYLSSYFKSFVLKQIIRKVSEFKMHKDKTLEQLQNSFTVITLSS